MKRFTILVLAILATLVGIIIAVESRAQEVTPDPIQECDPESDDPQCVCDGTFETGLCFMLPEYSNFQTPWYTTARLHIKEFQFTDPGPWGFRTGTYRSGLPNCVLPGNFPAAGCRTNGFYHIEAAGGEARPFVRFWVTGPAYDENGVAIFGTFDDRLLIEIKAVVTTCTDYKCRVTPSDVLVIASNAQFENGLDIESAYYNFNSHGFFANFWPQLNFGGVYDGVYGWIQPTGDDVIFDYSTVFGGNVGVRLVGESAISESLKFNQTTYWEPWQALDPTFHVVKHNLPEPGQNLMILVGVAFGAACLALIRRR